jgi:hypothetical protein
LLKDVTAHGQTPSGKAQEDSGMTYEEVFNFAYRDWVIPLAKEMAAEIGEQAYLGLMRSASARAARKQGADLAAQASSNDFQTFVEGLKAAESVFGKTQTFEIIEESERAIQVRFSECLCATVFRTAGAAEIGYEMMCHPDAALAEGFNPRLRMTRSKTLMEGHDCCDHRWFIAE